MAKTIAQGFREFLENLEVTDLQERTVSTRQQDVRGVLEARMNILDTFLTGSYRRSTMIRPLSKADVDIFIVLDPSYYDSTTPAQLLDQVKGVLKERYKTPAISRNGQAVTIRFSDFEVDVVPGFYREGGGFVIPDAARTVWIETDPQRHVEIWTAANKAHSGALVPAIKMVKAWNQTRALLRSFHLEVLVLNVLDGVTISNYPSSVRFVFDRARAKIRVKLPDPAGYSDDVAAHLNTEVEMSAVISRLEWARKTAVEAERLESSGKTFDAFAKWRQIFKDHFPAYE
jgi:hypothetical protein